MCRLHLSVLAVKNVYALALVIEFDFVNERFCLMVKRRVRFESKFTSVKPGTV